MKQIAIFFALLIGAISAQTSHNFTNGIRQCIYHHVTEVNACLLKEIALIQPYMGDGLPDLNIPRLEPLLLQNIIFRQSEPPVTIEAIFRNVMVFGITKFDLKYLDVDFGSARKLSLGMTIPSLTMHGQYTIGGNIFLLPIEGDGDFVTVLDGVIAEGTGDIVRSGDGIKMVNINIGFKIRDMQTELENLFQGNQVLSDTVHHFLRENGQLVLDEIRPGISSQLNNFIESLFNSMFSVLPGDLLLGNPELEKSILEQTQQKELQEQQQQQQHQHQQQQQQQQGQRRRRQG